MPIIAITSGIYSNTGERVQKLSENLSCEVITDNDIIGEVVRRDGIKEATLLKVIQSKKLAFNDFTHEQEKCIACMKKAISEYISKGNCIFHGVIGHLVPQEMSHVMRVLMITDKNRRIKNGMDKLGLSEKEIKKKIETSDRYAFLWINTISGKKAWDKSLYDIVIPTDKLNITESVKLILEHSEKLSDISAGIVEKEADDFKLAASVEIVLTEIGGGLMAASNDGNIVVTINKKLMMLSKFQQKIIKIVQKIPGVKSVDTKIGQNYYKNDIVHSHEFETPLRILLVDDEKDFVQTLSERLKMRQFASEVVYNGQEALDFTDREETEVMVLDLKMPGIDGFEVLRKIKQTKPGIEVIILTGHGSEKDKNVCMDLGAFAYLQKPADIDQLTDTMKRAYEKINLNKNN